MVNCQTDALNWNGMGNWVDVWWVSLEMFVRACVNHIWYGMVWYGMEQWISGQGCNANAIGKRPRKNAPVQWLPKDFSSLSFFLSSLLGVTRALCASGVVVVGDEMR